MHTQEIEYQDRDTCPIGEATNPPYFFGVYQGWQPTDVDPFATLDWVNHCKAVIETWEHPTRVSRIKNVCRAIIRRSYLPRYLGQPLKQIKHLLLTNNEVRILDVGGGFGDNFFQLSKALGVLTDRITYHVVDNKILCNLGRSFYNSKSEKIFFYESIPKEKYDLIVIVSTLQYIQEWQSFIRQLLEITTNSIFISRSPIRIDGPTFITLQSICPALGPSSLKKIGESNVSVIGEKDLEKLFDNTPFKLKESRPNTNYSWQFSRLPKLFRNVMYIDKHWERS